MKHIKYITTVFIIGILLVSCSKEKPSMVFFPDMYYPVAYDPYNEATDFYDSDEVNDVPLFLKRDGQTALEPVKGTVARNKNAILPIDLENTPEDYEKSKSITTSPLSSDSLRDEKKDLERGKKMYELTCVSCHGPLGDGQGPIVQSGAYSGVPNYKDRQITVGSVQYVITHGRNAMGSYAAYLTPADQWRVAEYVMATFKKDAPAPTPASAETPTATETNKTTK